MRDEFVRRRAWLTDDEFIDLVGAANLIPGPTSTELAMHIGHRRAGWTGLVVAGTAFILPAVLIVGVLAWAYVDAGTRFAVETLLVGVGPVVVALIVHAGWSIGRTAIRDARLAVLAVAAVAGAMVGIPEIVVLLGLGAIHALLAGAFRLARRAAAGVVLPGLFDRLVTSVGAAGDGWPMAVWAVGPAVASPLAIFVEFLVIGASLFGSGYVLVAFLEAELVDRLGWIGQAQLVDAVAVGQATPGPLFATGTFIGYLVDGPIGAVAATVGLFLPAYLAVALSIPILTRLRASGTFRAFLDGVNAAAVGLLAVVAVRLAAEILVEPFPIGAALVALVLLLRGVAGSWLVVAGALVGLGITLIGRPPLG